MPENEKKEKEKEKNKTVNDVIICLVGLPNIKISSYLICCHDCFWGYSAAILNSLVLIDLTLVRIC